jgi:hypothetical protein
LSLNSPNIDKLTKIKKVIDSIPESVIVGDVNVADYWNQAVTPDGTVVTAPVPTTTTPVPTTMMATTTPATTTPVPTTMRATTPSTTTAVGFTKK